MLCPFFVAIDGPTARPTRDSLNHNAEYAALNGRLSAYYLDSTWETQLPTFKTAAEQNVYQRLPDGTAIAIDHQEPGATDLSLKLDDMMAALANGPQTVWLSLPVSRNMKMPEMASRFQSVKVDAVEDEVSDAAPADIPRLVPNLALSAGDVPPALTVSMAIASVLEDDGVIKLGDTLPALLDLHAAPDLLDALRNFVHTLRSKAAFVARQSAGVPQAEQRAKAPRGSVAAGRQRIEKPLIIAPK